MTFSFARLFGVIRPLLAVGVGITLGLGVAALAGESPIHVLMVLLRSAFGSPYDLGMTLFYMTPMLFTGLSVAIAFHAGLFNVGAEGQLLLGALAAAAVGGLFPGIPFPLAPLLATLAAFTAGALWGAIPGVLKAYRGSHEVINTILMNFVAAALASYFTLYHLKNPASQNPETRPVGEGYLLARWSGFQDAPVGFALVIAVAVALLCSFFLARTVRGYRLKAVGESEWASRFAGISIQRTQVFAMALSGGIAGLVAVPEVLGNAGKFKLSFSPGYGFTGIAVALLARNRPLAILASAFLFGALHKGASNLDLETEKVSRDLSLILQALVVLAVAVDGLWDRIGYLISSRRKGAGAN